MSKSLLKIEQVSKEYEGHQALSEINLDIQEGCVFGLLGPNGAGKTSLIRIINHIIAPDRGQLFFKEKPLLPSMVERIGYLPEERGLYKKMKVGPHLLYLAQLKGMSKKEAITSIQSWLDKFEISDWWNKRIESLSKGMAQKVQFIATVMHEPELLILDEPFSGFDPINTELIKSEIQRFKEKGTTILFSTHNMSSVEEICDEIALINQSKIVLDGEINTIKQDHRTHTYEVEFRGNIIGFTTALWSGYELIDQEKIGNEHHIATIRLLNENKVNDLLRTIIDYVEVESIKEIIPSLNQIFIQTVKNQ